MTKRYHITTRDSASSLGDVLKTTIGSGEIKSAVDRFDGANNLLVLGDVESDVAEYLELLLDDDDSVIQYRVYDA